jgi:hypothetical protein
VSHLKPSSFALPQLADMRSCARSERQVWRNCNAALACETDVRCGPKQVAAPENKTLPLKSARTSLLVEACLADTAGLAMSAR